MAAELGAATRGRRTRSRFVRFGSLCHADRLPFDARLLLQCLPPVASPPTRSKKMAEAGVPTQFAQWFARLFGPTLVPLTGDGKRSDSASAMAAEETTTKSSLRGSKMSEAINRRTKETPT